MSRRSASTALAALLLGAGMVCSVRAGDSPFMAGSTAGVAAAAPLPDEFQLSGAMVTSKVTQVCVYDAGTKKSQWIAVGETSGPIRVVSYDTTNDHAVIVVNGAQKTIALRKSSLTGGPAGPSFAQAYQPPAQVAQNIPPGVQQPAAVAPPQPMTDSAKQERDARMLVSDLLEIGMQQRKAYEEAQRKAAGNPPNG